MKVWAKVYGVPMQIGGDQHQGWLPAGAAVPLPTPIRDVVMNLEIQSDGDDALLCLWSTDGSVYGDTWHRSPEEAEAAAAEAYGITKDQWERP
jgi:hypothetical protein